MYIDEWILEQRVVYVDLSLCDVYCTYKRIGRIFPQRKLGATNPLGICVVVL